LERYTGRKVFLVLEIPEFLTSCMIVEYFPRIFVPLTMRFSTLLIPVICWSASFSQATDTVNLFNPWMDETDFTGTLLISSYFSDDTTYSAFAESSSTQYSIKGRVKKGSYVGKCYTYYKDGCICEEIEFDTILELRVRNESGGCIKDWDHYYYQTNRLSYRKYYHSGGLQVNFGKHIGSSVLDTNTYYYRNGIIYERTLFVAGNPYYRTTSRYTPDGKQLLKYESSTEKDRRFVSRTYNYKTERIEEIIHIFNYTERMRYITESVYDLKGNVISSTSYVHQL
jgi:hypothetical protein